MRAVSEPRGEGRGVAGASGAREVVRMREEGGGEAGGRAAAAAGGAEASRRGGRWGRGALRGGGEERWTAASCAAGSGLSEPRRYGCALEKATQGRRSAKGTGNPSCEESLREPGLACPA